jgi:hypothetical protein
LRSWDCWEGVAGHLKSEINGGYSGEIMAMREGRDVMEVRNSSRRSSRSGLLALVLLERW